MGYRGGKVGERGVTQRVAGEVERGKGAQATKGMKKRHGMGRPESDVGQVESGDDVVV